MYIFSFRSRTQSMKFYDVLRGGGVPCKIINTPKEVSLSCGLSVQLEKQQIEEAKRLISYNTYDTFMGLFYIMGNFAERQWY